MNALYIHIPFCEKKCLYCSFVVSIGQQKRIHQYLQCIEKEAQSFKNRKIESLFVGGGTPTLLNNRQLRKLYGIIRNNFRLDSRIEKTIEANPEGITYEKAKLLADLGFNRVSLGIQSLNDKYLKYLGRCHDKKTALKAFENLRKAGFKNINVDLMYCFPAQTEDEVIDDLNELTSLNTEHVSLYSLTIEEHSRFYAQRLKLFNEHTQARFYHIATESLEASGFRQYEVSNFAKQGKESAHNINYWRGGSYIGLGIGAHSHIDGRRWWNVSKLTEYIKKLEENKSVEEGSEQLTVLERFVETLLFGLRMNNGVNLKELEQNFKCSLDDNRKERINEFIKDKFLTYNDHRLQTTKSGRLVLDEICTRLV